MFEDINNKNNAPGNLPVGGVEDMFAETDKALGPKPSASPTTPASAMEARKLQPKAAPLSAVGPAVPAEPSITVMPEKAVELNKIKGPSLARNLMIFLIVAIGVSILFGGSWLVYNLFVKSPSVTSEFELPPAGPSPVFEEPTAKTETTTVLPEAAAGVIDEEAVLFGEPLDTDADGLSDNRERELGTNPNDWDIDNDELSDGDEVLIWKSDPLNPDTDGDGFLDGGEVRNGYSPVGSGKIFEINQE